MSGYVNMTSLRLQAVPGMHTVTITTWITSPFMLPLGTFNISVHVESCLVSNCRKFFFI